MAWTAAGNLKGPTGATGPTGPTGPTGAPGVGIQIAGSVATYANLPGGLGTADAGKAYEVQADGLLYVWAGSAFPAQGAGSPWQGPQGVKGDTGSAGSAGSDGAAGARGSLWYTGSGAPGTFSGQVAGDMYMDVSTGNVWQLQ